MMAGYLDPPHDRVSLTLTEQAAFAQLERNFDQTHGAEPAAKRPRRFGCLALPSPRRRCRAVARCLGALRPAVWLLPIGLVFMTVGFGRSDVASVLGASLAGLGLCASLRPRRARGVGSRLARSARGARARRGRPEVRDGETGPKGTPPPHRPGSLPDHHGPATGRGSWAGHSPLGRYDHPSRWL
jgi:hypothetical protein